MKRTVTIIIPSYNRAHCLPVALSSVIAQTYSELEIVIVDDGSTDNTSEVCAAFVRHYGERIRYLKNGRNVGAAQARNIGIEAASGEFITFLDSDDVYYLNKIELQVNALESDAKAGLCYCYFATTTDFHDVLQRRVHVWEPKVNIYPEFLVPSINMLVTPAIMVRRDILESSGGFEAGMTICEDLDLWSRLLLVTTAAFVPDVLTCISIRRNETPRYFENILARDVLYSRVFERDPSLPEDFRRFLYTDLVDSYYRSSVANNELEETKVALRAMRKLRSLDWEEMREGIVKLALKATKVNKMSEYLDMTAWGTTKGK